MEDIVMVQPAMLSVKSITGGYAGIDRRLRNKYEGG